MFNNPLFLSREPFVVRQKGRYVKKLLETETEEKAIKVRNQIFWCAGRFFFLKSKIKNHEQLPVLK